MAKAIPDTPAADAPVAVKVTRPFRIKGEVQAIDSIVQVPRALAIELKSYGKAVDHVAAADDPPKASKPKKDPQP